MAAQARLLLDLQQHDAAIGRLARQARQIAAALADQTRARAAELAVKQAEQTLHARQSEQRDLEYELATLEARIKDHEARLYSGKGSPRDLQALQRDIEHDRQRRGGLEERALVAMEATEAARTELERIRTAARRVLDEDAAGRARLSGEREQVERDLQRHQTQRGQLAAAIDGPALALYDRLRQRVADGVAVAEVVQGRCEGCRTTLPTAEIQRARRTEGLVQCSACGRILHVPLG
jgi:predicted  nucleic acid-binding Zn-ribbon protein